MYASEAHLAPERRSVGFVRYIPKPRKSWTGWLVFLGIFILNETRGAYMVGEILKGAGVLH